jgi:hypothetical protein
LRVEQPSPLGSNGDSIPSAGRRKEKRMNWLLEHWREVVEIIGGVVIVARLIVKLTPTPADDSVLERVVNTLKHVGLHIEGKG